MQGIKKWSRRSFLEAAATTAALAGVPCHAATAKGSLRLVVDGADDVVASKPVTWALDHLTKALEAHGIAVSRHDPGSPLPKSGLAILVTSPKSAMAARLLSEDGPLLGRPFVDSLKGSRHSNMKELRYDADGGIWRVAFAFDPERKAVLLVGGDKSGAGQVRFYRHLLRIADKRFDQYSQSLRSTNRQGI